MDADGFVPSLPPLTSGTRHATKAQLISSTIMQANPDAKEAPASPAHVTRRAFLEKTG